MKKGRWTGLIWLTLTVLLCGCSARETQESRLTKQLPKLKIGIDDNYEPYSYVDENGDYAGLDIELAREACSRIGLEPVFVAVKWDSKNECLADGTIDCIWSCFSMNGREDDYNWVGPYMYSRQVAAVPGDSEIRQLKDLTGRRVAVMSSTKPESIFLEPDSERIPDVKDVYCLNNMDLVFSALQAGYVDAAAGHEIVMRQFMNTMPGNYRLLDEDLLSVGVGVAFEKGDSSGLDAQLDHTLEEMTADGTLEQILSFYEVSAENAYGGQ
jgi:polar amino acid transport system substrate-binding protein